MTLIRHALQPLLSTLALALAACNDNEGDDKTTTSPSTSLDTTGETPDAFCGDGILGIGEICDDKDNSDDYNPDAVKKCSTSCKAFAPHCGDGICTADELAKGCLPDCGKCGDGTVNPLEACDTIGDTNVCNGKDAGAAACKLMVCGDGYANTNMVSPEACDDGNPDVDDACISCVEARCGDGVLWTKALPPGKLAEQCDDPNNPHLCDPVSCQEVRTVFVSSAVFDGDLGGLGGADGQCDELARKAGRKGRFRAWLSDAVDGPATRFNTAFRGKYRLPDATVVADDGWNGLKAMDLRAAINQDESGIPTSATVWTNTLPDGMPVPGNNNCLNWNAADVMYVSSVGDSAKLDADWTNYFPGQTCDTKFRLYCFQDQ